MKAVKAWRVGMKEMIAIFLTVVMLTSSCGSAVFASTREEGVAARQNQAEDIPVIIDVLVLRPAGLVACALGLVSALIALPFAIPSDSMDTVSRVLIQEPFYYTFKRPLGKNLPQNPL